MPGTHFFYFIFRSEFVFLSPRYDIVRFKGSNLLINRIKVEERKEEIKLVRLPRKLQIIEEEKFNKAKSVWKTY
jgi:hypothetical protein